ncbi:Lcl domain-containing protein [Candidatus Vampirococcus lugosii]|uniref:Lcl C-terminal domain-containing protein n=1 Tax=Candidatus Vampirococcus lugosii TaxID=2789015 RepID=A0ABS5QML6_9BACT|nr:DUF1566 domain-containing protein [Candidatus Vampirococcus lugosii]MBS8122388.1 hypothetical protein [Candidatus Vampirococcus lugosii]
MIYLGEYERDGIQGHLMTHLSCGNLNNPGGRRLEYFADNYDTISNRDLDCDNSKQSDQKIEWVGEERFSTSHERCGDNREDCGSSTNGYKNTQEIIEHYESLDSDNTATAAHFCDNLTIDGYDDWYLPSTEELKLLFSRWGNRSWERSLGITGGRSRYWTSTQSNNRYAKTIRKNQEEDTWQKGEEEYVRCVRFGY